jgi:hypothetical protein
MKTYVTLLGKSEQHGKSFGNNFHVALSPHQRSDFSHMSFHRHASKNLARSTT